MSRIDDRSNSDNTIADRIIENSRKDQIKKMDRAEFEKKMIIQKKIAEGTPSNTSKTENARKAIQRFKEEPPVKPAVKSEEQPISQPPTKNSPSAKTGNKPADKKEDVKKEDAKSAKTEKKREDVVLDTAIKRSQEKQSEEGFSEKGSDDFFQAAVNMAAQPLAKTDETQKTNAPPKIPDEVLHQLVDRIFVGVDQKGLGQFIIELKDGVLGGGQINVSAQGGKIKLKFSGLDESSKRLVRNSKQELAARLRGKNLSLDSFEVV